MQATKNGWTVEGTPQEIALLIGAKITGTAQVKFSAPETADKTPRKELDWPKAQSLKNAGWSLKAIAEEIGTTYATVYSHFNAIKNKAKKA